MISNFVSGFHKRKKKRRREAEQKQGEALRRKRLKLCKKGNSISTTKYNFITFLPKGLFEQH
ncbi:hypothetical protein DVH24_003189 [Malus domestica]|uniref:P-type ATPase N-terminal domain-containing protein n=1 Tax=Malus domestica TaxID=3750 RepID=A0A498IMJ1_MALDO|nr:hypothetical protein DVH24_003189 [Malus domestica]